MTLDPEGARLLIALRRLGVTGPFLAGDAFGDQSFNRLLADEPEEQAQPGYFTDNLYTLTPVLLDSANADILAFADRFQARFGHDPVWFSVAGYDAANLAVAALRAVTADSDANSDPQTLRTAVLNYLLSLKDAGQALPGLLGPFWFDAERARPQAKPQPPFSTGSHKRITSS
jgi:ABC-type branched-subunit amino acid transport system substrate-binding protein